MFNQTEKSQRRRALDQVGGALLRAQAQADEHAAENVATAPFLYARLKTRINDELLRREENERRRVWNLVMQRSVPLMGLLAAFAVALFLFINMSVYTPTRANEDALFYGGDEAATGNIERVVFNDQRALSRDDVLSAILDDEDNQGDQGK